MIVNDEDIIVRIAQKEKRASLSALYDADFARAGVFWTRLLISAEDGSELVLRGLTRAQANDACDEIQKRYARAITAQVKDSETAGAALDEFYAAPHYIAARDVALWLRANAGLENEWLASVSQFQNRPLFAAAETSLMPKNIRRLRDLSGGREELQARNKHFAEHEIKECAAFFDCVEKTPLTYEQRFAAVVMEDRNLLIAAAGSGKTSALVGKIGYALLRRLCRPEEIIALAFNKKAADELRERINARLANLGGEKVAVATFHSLGLRLAGEASGEKPRVAEWAANMGENVNRKTDELVGELARVNKKFRALFGEFFSVFRWAVKPRKFFKTEAQYERHLESLGAKERGVKGIPTIKGDRVKSMEECAIANFLHTNGVEYEYEKEYEHNVADARHGQYRPDFYYPRAGLYHEHFGLDETGKAPAFMGGEEYERDAERKKLLHAEKGTQLFVSTSAQFAEDGFWDDLRRKLQERGVVFGETMQESAVLGWLRAQESRPIYKLMSDFLSRWKAGGWSADELRAKVERLAGFARARARVFLDAMILLREFYDGILRANNEVDFDDMLAAAARGINSGAAAHSYKLILADEFQDISRARAELIKAMLKQKPDCKFFAVGDDWQAIYRFAGADIGIMRRFAGEFGETSSSMLTRTFRSNQGIADVASQFICANPLQQVKKVTAADSSCAGVVGILRYKQDEDAAPAIETQLRRIAAENGGGKRKVFILGRYGLEYYKYVLPQPRIKEWQRQFSNSLEIEFSTAHKAKGLEADYVFVVGMNSGVFGFPNEKEDDDILSLVTPEGEGFEFAEERRLFYVALTRAKRKAYLLSRLDSPSPFIDEMTPFTDTGEVLNALASGGETLQVRLCPKCQTGVIIPRRGRYGAFYGCSEWRADGSGCDFTQNDGDR